MQQATIKTKLVITISIIFVTIFAGFMAPNISAQQENFKPYGSIAAEDELTVYHDGSYWVNTGANLEQGQFMKVSDLDSDYSIDQALERFNGIHEDTEEFTVQPSLYSDATFLYQLDSDLQFQMNGVFE